ncbi:hypothetical protein DDF67_06110 [Caulobacter endophyticus]|uniref:Uncharacterized protein n=1 Tax=Caulobacter endophyticus TaxID=2172652 RepID=A0A2T9K754_9CAUL|nr:hypothetical protein DDF67_06110 [Caulobacter endophyticus]
MTAAFDGALTSSGTSPSGPLGHLPLQGEDLWVRARALTRLAAELMERARGVRASPGCVSSKYRFDEA